MDDALRHLDTAGLRRLYATRQLSPVEYTEATLRLVDDLDPLLHAFVTVAADRALADAARAERRLLALGGDAWEGRPLLGVPLSVKDLTATEGIRTTRGSLPLRDAVPDRDAPAVARLRRAGALVLGKTTTSEGGWSAGTVNRVGPPAANPWDLSLSAGGSSGGAAAAVAAGLGLAATGTDGAGSIRIPAAFCGLVGLKPTHGRVPYVPYCPDRLAHLGPLTRTVADAELLVRVMTGPDARDPDSLLPPHEAPPAPDGPLRIAWIDGLRAPAAGIPADPQRAAVERLAAAGHHVEAISPPFDDAYPALVTLLAAAEAAGTPETDDTRADPARLPVVRHGRTLTAVQLVRAEAERAELTRRLLDCLARFDVLAMPTVPVRPFAVDAWHPAAPAYDDPLAWLSWAPAAFPFNMAGLPAVSVPAGHGPGGLPAGLQLAAARHHDALVLRLAREVEAANPRRDAHPERTGT
ncbi:amidase [Streptomyces albireticuli]|uniref:Amidase n=1 Tax=Streptomyces albireticuli TaxID=1940 RepID=A0A2A2DEM4_9ACTN|nr:amidase family protein [Streptomyces albireticuli]MCD9194736.1 amidase [Streptomyces albireticuli]PAU49941.1 amidase [Streptomyces albireticuli]